MLSKLLSYLKIWTRYPFIFSKVLCSFWADPFNGGVDRSNWSTNDFWMFRSSPLYSHFIGNVNFIATVKQLFVTMEISKQLIYKLRERICYLCWLHSAEFKVCATYNRIKKLTGRGVAQIRRPARKFMWLLHYQLCCYNRKQAWNGEWCERLKTSFETFHFLVFSPSNCQETSV